MKKISVVASIVALLAILGGCSSSSTSSSASSAPEKPAAMANGGFYAEESFKGRLYVFGTPKAHDAFKETQQVPHIAKSYIGAGPEGQTVVLEADAKANDLQDRLKAEYENRHSAKLP